MFIFVAAGVDCAQVIYVIFVAAGVLGGGVDCA